MSEMRSLNWMVNLLDVDAGIVLFQSGLKKVRMESLWHCYSTAYPASSCARWVLVGVLRWHCRSPFRD